MQQELNRRQARFVAAYAESGDAAAAARAAGYAPARAEAEGRRLLALPAVAAALRAAWQTAPKPRPITEAAVLRELSAIAFSDFTDYVRVEDGAVLLTDSRSLDYSHRAAIAGIKDTGKGVEIKLHDKQKALELLAKYLGAFDHPARQEPVEVILPPEAEEWGE